jgi:dipeptidyl aminopeptidase/acylaminoacyl peptidase
MRRACRWPHLLLFTLVIAASAAPVTAQYFGRNKVQYREFRFQVLKTDHFDVYYYPEERAAVEQAAQFAERWYARLSRIFNHQLTSRQPLILYASHPDFEQTNAIEGDLGEGTGGVTEPLKRRVVLPLGGSLAETDHVIGHELVHAFQYDITDYSTSRMAGSAGAGLERLPLWFVEGMAEYLSLGPLDPNTTMWMRDAASQEKMPTIHELGHPKYFPYRWGQALWAYVTGRFGDSVVSSLLRTAAASGAAEQAFGTILGEKPEDLSKEWQQALRDNATAVRQHTRRVTDEAAPLERSTNELTGYNVSPALSPDGRWLMFLSQRDILSIDLFLADAATGKVLRKVVNTAVDPHFSSLEFINSAGAWAPDSRRFVFSVVEGGKAGLVLLDVQRGVTEAEIPFPQLGEIFSPSWSPDGRSIAFSASRGGWTDLYVYDLRTRKTRQLTSDAFADLQPAWSPDGRTLAFVSDRFSTDLSKLETGTYQVVLLDVASGRMRPVEQATSGKNINPQWSPDGDLYFVSDRTGISNVYRIARNGRVAEQITNVSTGVSGITSISPAISYAPRAGRLALSVYENNKYNLYAMDSAHVSAGEPRATVVALNPALLPPERRASEQIVALQRNASLGLGAAQGATSVPYDPKLQLDLVGQPYVSAGVDPYGMFAGGGFALSFSDMLGDYSLGTAVQVNTSLSGGLSDITRSIGGEVAFVNRKHRWNYGVAVGQIPYLSAGFSAGVGTDASGRPVGEDQTIIYRQVERSASGVLAYPLNVARRLEFTGGVSNISFDEQLQTMLFDLTTGDAISNSRNSLPSPRALTLGQFSAAMVYDTASYGPTSPLSGQSYRLQVSPTVGSLRFTSVLADYRRYVMPVSFYTIAGRILHFGRYGAGGEDPRLVPIYLGYPNLVRGYDFNSFSGADCTPTPGGSCAEFDRLIGSRVLVGNLELRFPLLRPFGLSPGMYGPLPVEVAFFADAGVAWSAGQKPVVFGGGRRGVASAGVALRVNVFGALPLEFDIVRAFQQRSPGWAFQFNVSPGF